MPIFLKTAIIGGAAAAIGACALLNRGSSTPSLTLGSDLPDVTVLNQAGEKVKLSDLASEPYLLVYFYPKADTPGCTAQACSLRDAFAGLSDQGVRVIGVSGDSVKAQKAFKDKHQLPFELLADTEGKVTEAFGVPRRFVKFPARQAFLFKQGKLAWRDLEASTAEQAADVMAFLKQDA